MISKKVFSAALLVFMVLLLASPVVAGEADIKLPPLDQVQFSVFGGMSGLTIMYVGLFVCIIGLIFAIIQYRQTHDLPAHKSMLDVSNIIWETCKSYLTQQGKFLVVLWVLIAALYGLLFHGALA